MDFIEKKKSYEIWFLTFGISLVMLGVFLIWNEGYLISKLLPNNSVVYKDISREYKKYVFSLQITGIFFLYLFFNELFKNKYAKKKYDENHNLTKLITNLVVFTTFILLIASNISDANFWLDESGQIWISRGLNHFSPGGSPFGTLRDVWANNNKYNLDPGGFTLALYLWQKISAIPAHLRLLPFIFFVLTYFVVYVIVKTEEIDSNLAKLFPFLLLGSPLISHYVFELRAYSFEMLVSALSLLITIKKKEIISSAWLSSLAGICLSVGLTSRYSAIFPVLVTSFLIFIEGVKFKKITFYRNLFLYMWPIFLVIIIIYIFVLKHQNVNMQPPDYVANSLISNVGFLNIFLSAKAMVVWLPIVFLTWFCVRKACAPALRDYLTYSYLLLFLLVLVSALGLYPLRFYNRFDIGIHFTLWMSWIFLGILFVSRVLKPYDINKAKLVYFILIVLVLGAFSTHRKTDAIYDSYVECVDLNSNIKALANEGAIPTIRYLFELGPLKSLSKTNYDSVIFYSENRRIESNAVKISKDAAFDYDIVIFSFFDREHPIYKAVLENSNYLRCGPLSSTEFYVRR